MGRMEPIITFSINDKTTGNKEIVVNQVPLDILEENSIGTVYMEATYKNNTELPITSYQATILKYLKLK